MVFLQSPSWIHHKGGSRGQKSGATVLDRAGPPIISGYGMPLLKAAEVRGEQEQVCKQAVWSSDQQDLSRFLGLALAQQTP